MFDILYVQSAEQGWSVNDEEKRLDGYGRKSKGDLIEATKQRPQGSRVYKAEPGPQSPHAQIGIEDRLLSLYFTIVRSGF